MVARFHPVGFMFFLRETILPMRMRCWCTHRFRSARSQTTKHAIFRQLKRGFLWRITTNIDEAHIDGRSRPCILNRNALIEGVHRCREHASTMSKGILCQATKESSSTPISMYINPAGSQLCKFVTPKRLNIYTHWPYMKTLSWLMFIVLHCRYIERERFPSQLRLPLGRQQHFRSDESYPWGHC